MSTIPAKYKFLLNEPAPKLIIEALKIYGTKEIVGKQHNPVIMQWAKDTGLQNVYTSDEVPWCGLVIAWLCLQAGKPVVKDPLWALNWAKWGDHMPNPELGDIVTFKRPGGGHVGLYVGEDATTYHVLGGNQDNAFNITRIAKHRLFAARRYYSIAVPGNVRRIHLDASGLVSVNEA
jgi:uncharacterized protein (TIGR02594 family)